MMNHDMAIPQEARYLLLRTNPNSPWADEDGRSYHYGSNVNRFKVVRPNCKFILDRRTPKGVVLIGYGTIGHVEQMEPDQSGVTHYRAEYSRYTPFAFPCLLDEEEKILIANQPGYNAQYSIRVLDEKAYESLVSRAINQSGQSDKTTTVQPTSTSAVTEGTNQALPPTVDESRITLIAKRLRGSELGWFAECRRLGKETGRQRGINFDAAVMKRLFRENELESRKDIPLQTWHKSDDGKRVAEHRPLKHQQKNWRLTGDKVEGAQFADLDADDFMIFGLQRTSTSFLLRWEAIPKPTKTMGEAKELSELIEIVLDNHSMCLIDDSDADDFMGFLQKLSPEVWTDQARLDHPIRSVKTPVQQLLSNRYLLPEVMSIMASLSGAAQSEFIAQLNDLSSFFREMLDESICQVIIDQKKAWAQIKGAPIGFVDGGVAGINSIGSEPIVMRVGTYVVIPGLQDASREQFDFKPVLIDELFSMAREGGIFEEYGSELHKMRDASRIIVEALGALHLTEKRPELHYLFVHGPLVNPAAPYAWNNETGMGCPAFSKTTLARLGVNSEDVERVVRNIPQGGEQDSPTHFIAVYKYILEKLFNKSQPVAGVIERSSDSLIVTTTLLKSWVEDGFIYNTTKAKILQRMNDYRISDALLFACVLEEGQYLQPVQVEKNTLTKFPMIWQAAAKGYPMPWTTYVKPSQSGMPFRLELSRGSTEAEHQPVMDLVVHMSRLLPRYLFPVGLDIVDKYAKIPAWMARHVSKEQAAGLLKASIEIGDSSLTDVIRVLLAGQPRDWLFRPHTV